MDTERTYRDFVDDFFALTSEPFMEEMADCFDRLTSNYKPDGMTATYAKRAIAIRLLIEAR